MTKKPLRTVRVPVAMEPLFQAAEEVVSRYFSQRVDNPAQGTIEVFGQRYILVRAAALSVEFFGLVEELYGPGREAEAEEFARNILFDLAHAIGKADARDFHAKMGLEDPIARLSAGPVHFAHTGWAFVDIHPESVAVPGPDFHLVYDHPYSFECEAWLQSGREPTLPACIMNAGYSSGWCEESFEVQLVSSELSCRAKGDQFCRFVMAPPSTIERWVSDLMERSPGLAGRTHVHAIPDFFSRKRLEEELRESRAQLERRVEERTRELYEANERLKSEILEREAVEARLRQTERLEAVGRLTGGIAHDFNNLLTVIQGNADLALELLAENPGAEALVEEVRKASLRAAELTRQLLAFSRQQVLNPRVLDLNAVVAGLGRLLGRVIGEDVALDLALDARRPRIRADAGQIEQVLMNLAVNARDAMPEGGRLRIETRLEPAPDGPGSVDLVVEDSGTGMDAAMLGHIFEPFYTTKERGKGTGLGLATVYGIVSQSQGDIRVESEPGRGSSFTITLPATDEPLSGEEPGGEGRDAPGAARRILLVEDEPGVRRFLAEVLRKEGYEVLQAAEAQEALRLVEGREDELDLLLTDVVMPGLTGKQLAERLGALHPDLPVLFMSGYADHILESESGRFAFLQKPCTPRTVLEKVRQALEG